MLLDYQIIHNTQTGFGILFFALGLGLFIRAFRRGRFWPGAAAAFIWAIAMAGLLVPASFSVEGYVVADADGTKKVRKMTVFGAGHFSFANGQETAFSAQSRPQQLIINNTAFPVVVRPVNYVPAGMEEGLQEQDFKDVAIFEPFSLGYTDLWIQYAGKESPPDEEKGYRYGEVRYWLTWDH